MKNINNLFKNSAPAVEVQTEAQTEAVGPNNWFTSKEHHDDFIAAFKHYANNNDNLTASHFLLYAILRNQDWKKGWTLPKNENKHIEHKQKLTMAFITIIKQLNDNKLLKPFGGNITTEMLMAVRVHLIAIRSA